MTNILNTFKHDKHNYNSNNVYTIFDSNGIKDAFKSGDGRLKGAYSGEGALKILNQNKNVKSLGISYEYNISKKLSQYANDPDNLYLIVGAEKLGKGQHFFNILSAPDENGNFQAWEGWKIQAPYETKSPYATKNVDALLSIRVFKIPGNLLEQLDKLNIRGINPDKSYLENGD